MSVKIDNNDVKKKDYLEYFEKEYDIPGKVFKDIEEGEVKIQEEMIKHLTKQVKEEEDIARGRIITPNQKVVLTVYGKTEKDIKERKTDEDGKPYFEKTGTEDVYGKIKVHVQRKLNSKFNEIIEETAEKIKEKLG